MKKFRLLNILVILLLIVSMPTVYAYDTESVNVDKENITIESIDQNIYSGSTIKISETLANQLGKYKLYFQYVSISDDAYKKWKDVYDKEKEWAENFLKDKNVDSYTKLTGDDKTEYNTSIAEYEKEKEELLPLYKDSSWIESTDNKAPLDLKTIPEGTQPHVLWIKVEPEGNEQSVYNDFVVLPKGEKKEELPKTGDNMLFVGLGAILVAGIAIVSYKKINA